MAEENDALLKRVLPHSIEAEQSVIGAMLMDRDAIIAASEIITEEDFYQRQYGVMFQCMVELFNEGQAVDVVNLQNRLKEKDVPPEVASLETLRDIITTVPTSANVRAYAGIVREKSMLRRLIRVNEEIANTCYAGKEKLEGMSVTLSMKAGEGGKAFGSVSGKEIAAAAKEQLNLEIDKKKLVLPEAIKTFGTHEVPVKLHKDVTGKLTVKVVEA